MKLLVTDNLVSDLSHLDSFNINLEKISIKDIPNQEQSLFDDDKFKFIFDEFITISSFNKLKIDLDDNYIFQIKKSNLNKFNDISQEIEILYSNLKKKNINPWDLSNSIFNVNKNYELDAIQNFTSDENTFKTFLSYLSKELVRIKLLYQFDTPYVSKILNEKIDFKYKDSFM